MAIEKVELMHDCFPKHLHMGTAQTIEKLKFVRPSRNKIQLTKHEMD